MYSMYCKLTKFHIKHTCLKNTQMYNVSFKFNIKLKVFLVYYMYMCLIQAQKWSNNYNKTYLKY